MPETNETPISVIVPSEDVPGEGGWFLKGYNLAKQYNAIVEPLSDGSFCVTPKQQPLPVEGANDLTVLPQTPPVVGEQRILNLDSPVVVP